MGKNKERKGKKKKAKKEIPDKQLKGPPNGYYIFSMEKREENKDKKYTVKELGDLWKNLPNEKKEYYQKRYEEMEKKIEEEKKKQEDNNEEDGEKNRKVKVKALKEHAIKNSKKACNCGNCDECKREESNEEDEKEK